MRLRAKDYAAHDRWLVNLQDVITDQEQQARAEAAAVPCQHFVLCGGAPAGPCLL